MHWNCTYKRDAIGITPTRMPWALHLQETCNQDNTYRSHAIRSAPQLIAATAGSIFGQPLHEYLNAITIASTHTILVYNPGYMQSESHLQQTCNWNCTYKRDAIGIAPIRMPLESHLQETCNQDNTYRSHVIGIAPQLIAAMARSIFDQPFHKYLNAITIALTHTIADTGATSIFITDGVNVINKRITYTPLTINMLDGRKVKSTHIFDITIPGLPTVLTGHVVPHLAIASPIRLRPICNAGCTVTFDKNKCNVIYNGNVIL
jgi:hypothetical protein